MAKAQPSKIRKLKAQQAEVESADAVRLKMALLQKQCEHCGQFAWKVTSTVGDVRYLTCKGCSRPGKITVPHLPKPEDEGDADEERQEAPEGPEATEAPPEETG